MKILLLISTALSMIVISGLLLIYSSVFSQFPWSDTSMLGACILISYAVPLVILPVQTINTLLLVICVSKKIRSIIINSVLLTALVIFLSAANTLGLFKVEYLSKCGLTITALMAINTFRVYWSFWSTHKNEPTSQPIALAEPTYLKR